MTKAFYSLLAGIVGGYLITWISKEKSNIAIFILIAIQYVSLIWAGFISDLSVTGPIWMWIYLLIIIPMGIWLGYKCKSKTHHNNV